MAEDPRWQDDSLYQEAKARIERAATILREFGVRHFDPREMGAPIDHSQAEIDAYLQRLEDEAIAFIKKECPATFRLKCERCREEMFGLCDEHAKMLTQHDWSEMMPDDAWNRAKWQADALRGAGEYTITNKCTNPKHGPGSARWQEVYSAETKRMEGRCGCADKVLKLK